MNTPQDDRSRQLQQLHRLRESEYQPGKPKPVYMISTTDPNFGLDVIKRDNTPKPGFSWQWFANWQRAATFTLDIEVDWSDSLFIAIEFVIGIGFQVGFALTVGR